MQRSYIPLFLVAIVALIIAGCGGGGAGNGGGSGTIGTTSLSGTVIGSNGNALSDATVTITADGRSPVSGTTDSQGGYTIRNAPANKDFALTVTASGISRTWTGMRLNMTDMPQGTHVRMHVALGSRLIQPGEQVILVPDSPNVTVRFSETFYLVMDGSESRTYQEVWTVIGNVTSTIELANTGFELIVSDGTLHDKVRVAVAALRSDQTTLVFSVETVVGVLKPPPTP